MRTSITDTGFGHTAHRAGGGRAGAARGLVACALTGALAMAVMVSPGCVVRHVDYTEFAKELDALDVAATYRIGPPDELLIRSGTVDELDGRGVTVRRDGTIDLPAGYGEVAAAGRTRDEVAVAIGRQLREHFAEPEIAVEVERYASQHVYVRGHVASPGAQAYDGANTAITALAAAQPTAAANPRRILVLGPTDEGGYALRTTMDLEALRRGEAGASDVVLRPGEVVHVPAHRTARGG